MLVYGTAVHPAQLWMVEQEPRNALEEFRRVPTVVVWERYDVGRHVSQADITCPAQPNSGAEMDDRDVRGELGEHREEPLIRILIDDDQPRVPTCLSGQ